VRRIRVLLIVAAGALVAPAAGGQTAPPDTLATAGADAHVLGIEIGSIDTLATPAPESVDAGAFRYVYGQESRGFTVTMQQINSASRRLFIVAVPVAAGASLIAGSDLDPAVRLAASELGAGAAVYLLKFAIRRPRPYVGLSGVEARVEIPEIDHDPYSLPSGHAAVSFALATSTSLSYPRWYVIAPTYAWAATTALSRVWHGVHYPSDVALGAAMGTGVAVLVHLFLPDVDPDDVDPLGPPPPPTVNLRFAF
jgi:membrane-associated phospholipid phosphatase